MPKFSKGHNSGKLRWFFFFKFNQIIYSSSPISWPSFKPLAQIVFEISCWQEQLIVCGDWNGHIGSQSTGFEEVHGGQAIGKRNTEGERILEFAFANELVVGNTWFKKKPEHLVTYQSGNAATQIDFILYRQSFRKQVSNVKVILGEECASQHRLLVGDFRVSIPPQPKRKFVPRIKVWKLRDPEKQAELSEVFKAKTLDSQLSQTSTVDERWTSLKDKLLQATKQVCGVSSNHPWRKQTGWWNNQVEEAVREKRRCFKLWKAGGSRAAYNTAKRTIVQYTRPGVRLRRLLSRK